MMSPPNTYAADWSEYHHTDGGWYNLDPLWASSNIDVIGIDAYFPLTDALQSELGYDVQQVIDGWTQGEGYDWYYSDAGRTVQTTLQSKYAWKNISWWWNNPHVNPDSLTTSWIPGSKKIWFTEFGFPSVDGATNQPNVFYDPTSSESFFPYHSRGQVDFRAIFSKFAQYGFQGWAVLEWECCLKNSEDGAAEGARFIKEHIIRVSERAFDDFVKSGADASLNRAILGL